MSRIRRSLLWGSGVFAILLVFSALVFSLKFRKATRGMSPAPTGHVNDSVFVVKDRFVNAYLFYGEDGYLMVDAGMNKKNVGRQLDMLGIDPSQVSNILLTHTDGDHIGAIGLFPEASVYLYWQEEQMIDGTTGKTKFRKTKWKHGSYQLLSEKDSLEFNGYKVGMIPTPGHTPGSVCYIIGHEYLVTGDNLIVKDGKYEQFVEMFNMDTPAQIKSLNALPDPAMFSWILTGHHGIIKMKD